MGSSKTVAEVRVLGEELGALECRTQGQVDQALRLMGALQRTHSLDAVVWLLPSVFAHRRAPRFFARQKDNATAEVLATTAADAVRALLNERSVHDLVQLDLRLREGFGWRRSTMIPAWSLWRGIDVGELDDAVQRSPDSRLSLALLSGHSSGYVRERSCHALAPMGAAAVPWLLLRLND